MAVPAFSPTEAASIYETASRCTSMSQRQGVTDFVIVPAASSSVGLAAIQLANRRGANCDHATDKIAELRGHRAEHVIATEESDLVAEVMRITDGKGARVVFDPVGGPYVDTLAKAMSTDGSADDQVASGQPTTHPHGARP